MWAVIKLHNSGNYFELYKTITRLARYLLTAPVDAYMTPCLGCI